MSKKGFSDTIKGNFNLSSGAPVVSDKILVFDLETSHMMLADFSLWRKGGIDHSNILQDWYIFCAAYKWLGEEETHGISIHHNKRRFKKDPSDDYIVVKKLHGLMMKAEVLAGHNIKKFDWKKLNTRFLAHGLSPVPKKRMIDTLSMAKKDFAFSSNRLDYIADFVGVGAKMHTSKGLWLRALKGDPEALEEMLEYCKVDVKINEDVYYKLRPYSTDSINLGTFVKDDETDPSCPKCESQDLIKRGYAYTNAGKFHRYNCKCCGGWSRGRENLLSKKHTGTAPSAKFLHSQ